ncbi:MAG: d(CMP) kinase [Alphaproteobacteria bacterium]
MTVIAVDGPAASGKGTVSRMLANELGFAYLDTGKLYRAVGLAVVTAGGDPSDPADAEPAARSLDPAGLDDPELKSDAAASAASKVAAIDGVRAALLQFQRDFAARPPNSEPGAVLDGRDIGTVVCPDADVKIFVTASVEIRAERRHKELLERGDTSIYARVLQDLQERDARDSARSVAPMKPADDAFELDTTSLSIDQAFEAALTLTKATLAKR